MADLLYGWEFGANLGHVGSFLPLAHQLRQRGHLVHWAVSQPSSVGGLLARQGFECLPAPVAPEIRLPGAPASYADILLRFGYQSPAAVLGLVQAWRSLFRLSRARLLVADHAPTAILAARTLDLPVALFSNGFSTPPDQYPLPSMRHWSPVPSNLLRQSDDAVRNTINTVLAHYGKPGLQTTSQLFQVAEHALVTFPELDHYHQRGPSAYWGALPFMGGGHQVDWSVIQAPRFFVYMRTQVPSYRECLRALQRLGAGGAVYFPDIPPDLDQQLAGSSLQVFREPVNLRQAVQGCDAVVCYGSSLTTVAALVAGKPLLLMPSHLEQYMQSIRAADMGAGMVVNPEQPPPDWAALLQHLLEEPSYRANAQAFARKYQHFDQENVLNNLTLRLEQLIVQAA